MFNRIACLALIAAAVPGVMPAQSTSGSTVGSVADSSGSVITDVAVRATLVSTRAVRETLTGASGNFVFSGMTRGVYYLSIEKPGFKKFESRDINLPPNERLALGELRLEVGSLDETVSVTAGGAVVQTASAERSGLVSSSQMQNLTVITRDFSALIAFLPGVVASPRGQSVGFGGNATFNVQGNRNSGNNITIDGVPASDLGNAVDVTSFVSMDTINEVKILVSGFSPEFGRKPGANIQAVTKSGSREFHGAGYWYKRHEMFNAGPA